MNTVGSKVSKSCALGLQVFFALPFVMVPNLSGLGGLQAIFCFMPP